MNRKSFLVGVLAAASSACAPDQPSRSAPAPAASGTSAQIESMRPAQPDPCPCPPGWNFKTYDIVRQRLANYTSLDVWISRNYSPEYWNPRFAREPEKIDKMRNWAMFLSDKCAADAYQHNLDVAEHDLSEARRELATHETLDKQNEYERQLQEKPACDRPPLPKPPEVM